MKKRYNFIFFFIWGLLFGGIPLGIMFIPDNTMGGNKWFLLIFVIIGFAAIAYSIYSFVKMVKDSRLLKTGKEAVGTYVTKQGYGSVNNVAMFKVVFEFKNDQNVTQRVISNEIYTIDEVERLEKCENFKIKYKGNNAVIVPDGELKPKQKDVCEYCGTKFEGEKCPYCGASKNYK